MGVCLYPSSICKDQASAINVHRSIGIDNQISEIIKTNSKIVLTPKYCIQDIGYKIKINLVFFCNNNNIKNSYTYKFHLYIDNSDLEEENFISLGSTEAIICQNKIKFNKIFETNYFFTKGQRIKICCLENEKNINTSSFYLGKMINGFDNPKLIIEKDNNNIGELLILINKEENSKLFKNKKCLFSIELPSNIKFSEEGNYCFCIYNGYNELMYKSKEFKFDNNSNNNDNQLFIFKFFFEIRKHFIFYRSKTISLNLYSVKSNNKINIINNASEDNENKNIINNNKSNDEINNNNTEYELIGSVNITNEELLNNNGMNSFKLSSGILSSLFKESIVININYKENDYTPFLEYIRFQLHLNLIIVLENYLLKDNSEQIKNIINGFFSILSLYNNEEQKIIYIKSRINPIIFKANNTKEIFNNENNEDNNQDRNGENGEENKIIPIIDILLQKFMSSEENKGFNKYFIVLVFTDKKFSDINSDIKDSNNDLNLYQKYENIPFNVKVFNLGDENNYNETNNINMNVFNSTNGDIKYERLMFQFYNINKQNNKKEKGNKYLNDIPFLIEDFFEVQKMTKFSIFDQ